eukprot:GHVP01035851.1.p1 GENE.GHVP01035851.1~~GHVP01035851.1.p1  ORF type:complete len:1062 (+),score=248.29 GHVP01035851.1:357-3542(+)
MRNGLIEQIELCNFMCHGHLTLSFIKQNNYISGRNGSGKSTILAALTIVFGGGASTTQRGGRIQDFVKEGGKSNASVEVLICNKVSGNRYRYNEYGDSIRIKRSFNTMGVSRYEIKNITGRTVSTKRDEVLKITSHFGIFIDNPLTILTQEVSKKFMTKYTNEDRYNFFLEATRISKLEEENRISKSNLEEMERSSLITKRNLENEENELDKLKKIEEKSIYKKAIKSQIEVLKAQIKYRELEESESSLNKLKNEIDCHEEKELKNKEELENQKKIITRLDQKKIRRAQEIDHYSGQIRENKSQIDQINRQNTNYDITLHELEEDEKILIEGKNKYLEAVNKEPKNSSESIKLKLLEEERNQIKEKIEINESKRIDPQYEKQDEESNQILSKIANIQKEIEKEKRDLDGDKRAVENRINIFGKGSKEISEDIKKEKGFVRTPIGPVGMCITLKESRWGKTISSILGGLVSNYIVHCHEDRDLLQKICSRHNSKTQIIIMDYDKTGEGYPEPDKEYLTGLRVLSVDNPVVKSAIILFSGIERILLIADRKEAERIMESKPKNADTAYTDYAARVSVERNSKSHMCKLGKIRDFFEDTEKKYGDQKLKVSKLEKELEDAMDRNRIKQAEIKHITNMDREFKFRQGGLKMELKRKEEEIHQQKNRIELENIDRIGYDKETINEEMKRFDEEINQKEEMKKITVEQKMELEEKLKILTETINEDTKKRITKEEQMHEIASEQRKINRKIQNLSNREEDDIMEKKERYMREKRELERKRVELDGLIEHRDSNQQIRELDGKRVGFDRVIEHRDSNQQIEHRDSNQQIEHRDSNKQIFQLEAELKGIINALKDLEEKKEEGIENMTEEEIKKSIEYHQKEKEKYRQGLVNTSQTIAATTQAVFQRNNTIEKKLRGSANHIISSFQNTMNRNGMSGNVIFEHSSRELEIESSPNIDEEIMDSNTGQLSGGEKSLTMVNFFISVWGILGTPFCCLDEFDVYMDSVNRLKAMKMIEEYGIMSGIQFIFITPLDLKGLPESIHTNKIVLKKVDRGQLTIEASMERKRSEGY